jgi:hypothetical protein
MLNEYCISFGTYMFGVVGVEAVDLRESFGLLGGFPGETGLLR